MSPRAAGGAIPRDLWEECWEASGRVGLHRRGVALLTRRRRLQERLDEVFREEERHGPLPWPFGQFARKTRELAGLDRTLHDVSGAVIEGCRRGRGRETRTSLFVRLMFEREPTLTRSPGAWMRACDDLGTVEEVAFSSPDQRREYWKSMLKLRTTSRGRKLRGS